MQVSEEMFVLALIAISFTGAVAILLVILTMRVTNQRQNNPLSPPPVTPPTTLPSIIQSKRIANSTVAMSTGLTALVFAAQLVPIQQNWVIATVLLVFGVVVIFLAWLRFWSIK